MGSEFTRENHFRARGGEQDIRFLRDGRAFQLQIEKKRNSVIN